MAFQIGGIRYSSERVDMEVMDSVGSYGEVEGLSHAGNLHPDADSTAVGDIRLREGNRTRCDEILKFVKGMHIFSGGNRQGTFAGDADVTRQVIGDGRLFEPVEIEFRQSPETEDRERGTIVQNVLDGG